MISFSVQGWSNGRMIPLQVSAASRSRPSSQRPSVNSRTIADHRGAAAPQDSGSLLDVLATVCAVKGERGGLLREESPSRCRSCLKNDVP